MKSISILLALSASSSLLHSQDLIPAVVTKDGEGEKIFIEASNNKTIRYRESERTVNRKEIPTVGRSIFFFTPPEYDKGLENFENRNYAEAQKEFALARENNKKTSQLKGNYSTLAGFYEMECARKLGKYEELETLFSKFQPGPLSLETDKTQLEVYPLYNAVRTEDWARLDILCTEWDDRKVPGRIRAQIEYCHGLALEGINRPEDALIAFNKAMVADYAASEILVRKAALSCFRVYSAHPDVVLARKLHGTPDENPNSAGALLLGEAAALVELWDTALGRGEALPADYKAFAKYKKK